MYSEIYIYVMNVMWNSNKIDETNGLFTAARVLIGVLVFESHAHSENISMHIDELKIDWARRVPFGSEHGFQFYSFCFRHRKFTIRKTLISCRQQMAFMPQTLNFIEFSLSMQLFDTYCNFILSSYFDQFCDDVECT